MKNIITTILIASIIAACGDSNSIEAKKAKVESLKTKQAELASEIATLNDEIIALGDTMPIIDSRAKVVAISNVTKQTFIHAIDVQGKVDGDENITYSVKVPSVVTKINVKAGQRISNGQILAELDSKVMKAQYDALKKQYELVKILYEKRKELWDQKVGSEIEYLQAKNQKEGLEKQMEASKEALDMYYIKADFNGTVDEIIIKVGQNVAPGVRCITVVNPDKLKIKADLSEAYSSMIQIGNPAIVNFPDIAKSIQTKVSYSSQTIDAMTRTFNLEINLPNDKALHANMVATIKITDYEKANSIVIPINTIQQLDGVDAVFISVKNGDKMVAKKVIIKVGKQYNGLAEVLSGLNVGDALISVGFQDLTDGQSLKL